MTFLRRAPFIRRRGGAGGGSIFSYSGTLTAASWSDGFNNYYGYSTLAFDPTPYGSISPSSAIIVDVYEFGVFGILNIVSTSDPGQFSINYINYNGTIFNSSSASYAHTNINGTFCASWTFSNFGIAPFVGVAKTLIIA